MSYEMNVPVVAPIEKLFPSAPKPARGCDVCGALIAQWRKQKDPSSAEYDLSAASDTAVEITRHHQHRMPK